MNKRLAIVHPWANLDTVPSLTQAAELLARAGYRVDVLTRAAADYVPPRFDHPAIDVLVPRPRRRRSGVHRLLPGRWSRPLEVLQRHRRCPYRLVFGVDPQGLLEARHLFRFVGCPVAYVSLEILVTGSGSSARQKRWKRVETEMAAQAPFVVVQDAERAELLRRSVGLELDDCVLLPNAPLGPARRRGGDHWHRRFGLAEEERIVLHAGSLDPWTGIDEIVAAAAGWPEGFKLVVHSRADAAGTPRLAKLRQLAAPNRVFFSLRGVPREEYETLVDSADVGIAFYRPDLDPAVVDENTAVLGLSSGKLAYYLRAGLPVVVNDAASVGALVREWRCGLAVGSGDAVGAALREIAADDQGYSRRALAAFDEHLDFERAFGAVLERLDKL